MLSTIRKLLQFVKGVAMSLVKFFILFFSLPLFAIQWEIIGQNSSEPVFKGNFQADLKQNLGQITVNILDKHGIEYIGNEFGMNSILGTPTGSDLHVIESATRMKAYGWCVRVDKVLIPVTPDKFYLPSQESRVTWYFGYMQYNNNVWFEDCYPAYAHPLKPKY